MVSEHGSTFGLDGWNLFSMHARRLYMSLLCMHGSGHCYSCVSMQELMMFCWDALFMNACQCLYVFMHALSWL